VGILGSFSVVAGGANVLQRNGIRGERNRRTPKKMLHNKRTIVV
jgi:hypothetical protein